LVRAGDSFLEAGFSEQVFVPFELLERHRLP
jgi:hypothetical protein